MSMELYIAFVLISTGIIVIPGPNVLLIVANSVRHGSRAGLLTVAGTSSAMSVQLLISLLGVATFLALLAEWFGWLRFLGMAYLIYLGLRLILRKSTAAKQGGTARPVTTLSARRFYIQGFLVSLFNPKTILFFSAFLPQFVSMEHALLPQLILLSLTFLTLATIFDGLYALSSGKLSKRFSQGGYSRLGDKIAGVILLSAGVLLGLSENKSVQKP